MAVLPTLTDARSHSGVELFPGSRSPEGARAGLLLHYGEWDAAHSVAQDLRTAEGSFWHGIIHRLEPDPGNSGYWFRRAGAHPVFGDLRAAVREIESRYPTCRLRMGVNWDPFAWIDFYESARAGRGLLWQMAGEIGQAEWRLLYQYCAEPVE